MPGSIERIVLGLRATGWASLIAVSDRVPKLDRNRLESLAENRAPHTGWVPPRRAAGAWRRLKLEDNLERTLFLTGAYDRELQLLLRSELRPGDVFADIGANIGVIAATAAASVTPQGTVHCFEAAPDVAVELTRALGGLPAVHIHATALGRQPGEAVLRSNNTWGDQDRGVRGLYGDGDDGVVVPVTTFDDWAQANGVTRLDAVKIDVEGAEHDVLQGMRGSLAALRPRLLVIELVEEHLGRAGSSVMQVQQLLADAGYARSSDGSGANVAFRPTR